LSSVRAPRSLVISSSATSPLAFLSIHNSIGRSADTSGSTMFRHASLGIGQAVSFKVSEQASHPPRVDCAHAAWRHLRQVGLLESEPEELWQVRAKPRLTPAELVDRYGVRDVDMRYLFVTERETTCDYTTLTTVALHIVKLFWVDLGTHEPGLRSLALSPEQAWAWKKRLQTLPSGRPRRATTIKHPGTGRPTGGLNTPDRARHRSHGLGQQPRVGRIGHGGFHHGVSARTLSVRSSFCPAALANNASLSPATAASPQRLVSFINVVGCGTRVPKGMRQNRCQEIESPTSRHSASKPSR
jgi:hypothetical protein